MNKSNAMTDTFSQDDILEYLQNNPDFFRENPDILDEMTPPQPSKTKGIADFQSYMIKRLKEDKEKVLSTTQQIVENTRANMNNQQRIHGAVLSILEARSFDEFIHSITFDLSARLNVDIAALVVESNEIPHVHNTGIRLIPEGTVNKWMADKTVMMEENISGIEAIYGGGATLVRSQLLLRIDISMNTPPAILAFGSREATTFQNGQATDQILFLARVIERCFRNWLDLPKSQ